MKKLIKILAAAFFFNMAALYAQGAEHEPKKDAHEEHQQHEEHAHSHHLSLFLGVTSELEKNVHAFTAGLDYEYRLPFLNRLLGVGALTDFAFFPEQTNAIFAGFVGIHPIGGLKILLAPGVETVFGLHPHTAFLGRVSLGYDIMISNFSITPIASVDYIPETKAVSLVYGLSAGIGF
ncbi:MAG: hypothetical protein OEV78_04175 [Spirochaetia bacterium]|nr:hypothetical protein [Spirochaetia bacterium]